MRKIIHDTVIGYYKQPKKYNRNDDGSNDSRDGGGPIRDLVNKSGPMANLNKTQKSVDFSGQSPNRKDKANVADGNAKLIELPDIEVDLGNDKFNDTAADIRHARDAIRKRIIENSPNDAKSQKSKKSRKKKS